MTDREQEAFAEMNLDALQRDMAAGQGEHLGRIAESRQVIVATQDSRRLDDLGVAVGLRL